MKDHLRPAFVLLVLLSVLTGLLYPLAVTVIAQTLFPSEALGSLVMREGKATGSRLIGQSFTVPRYFWGRLSATEPVPYNAASSSGSNLGPLNKTLRNNAVARIEELRVKYGRSGPFPFYAQAPAPDTIDAAKASAAALANAGVDCAIIAYPTDVTAAMHEHEDALRAFIESAETA